MKATEILKQEHQAILLVIAQAEKEVASIEKSGTIHVQRVREMADFFQNFVDRCHHAKEEKHLFVGMQARGLPGDAPPLAVMLYEHEQGRACVRAIAEAVSGTAPPDAAAIQKAKENLAAYARLLRAHIDKENQILYTMADRILTPADQQALAEAFERVESEELGEGVHEKYHAWIEKQMEE